MKKIAVCPPAAHVPPARTPFQDYVATQRRMVWVERLGKFAVGLVSSWPRWGTRRMNRNPTPAQVTAAMQATTR
jgi:hypothetical protein